MNRLLTLIAAAGISAAALAATPASYPGGDKALNEFITANLSYPPQAKANGIEGVVTVTFNVGADGKISAPKVVRMVDPDLEKEALRIVAKMPAWTPARDDNGNPAAGSGKVAVPFSLEN